MEQYALLGYPLGHTMSPFIHQKLFVLSGRDNIAYALEEIAPEHLAEKVPLLFEKYCGFNVTIPHKVAILPFLKTLEPAAKRYGAVNVVDCRTQTGHNTDVVGFLRSIAMLGASFQAGPVLILGCGGVGRMMAQEALFQGASSLTLAVRETSLAQADQLANSLSRQYPNATISTTALDRVNGAYHLIINATPVGMYPQVEACPLNDSAIQKAGYIFDAVYNPTETKLVQKALEAGIPALSGVAMLVWQAAAAQEIWNGTSFGPLDIAAIIGETEEEIHRSFGG